MKRGESARLFRTMPHDCGYYAGRIAENLVIDPGAPNLGALYGFALARGYRRSGGHLYRPACPGCQACVATRLDVNAFQPNRTQARIARRNADLSARLVPAQPSDEHVALYQRYLSARHAGGGMDGADAEDFRNFLLAPFARTLFLDVREQGRLLACAVTDHTDAGLSAVYTFYDPAEGRRSLGVDAILRQVNACRALGLPHLYLGFWLDGHPKMGYKATYRPQERLGADGLWTTVDEA